MEDWVFYAQRKTLTKKTLKNNPTKACTYFFFSNAWDKVMAFACLFFTSSKKWILLQRNILPESFEDELCWVYARHIGELEKHSIPKRA